MYKTKYIIAIIIAIAVLVTNQVYIQHCLSLKNRDAEIINKAGKQRMYSQKILHLYEHWYITGEEPSQLQKDVIQWKNAHEFLMNQEYLKSDKEKDNLTKLYEIIQEFSETTQINPNERTIRELNFASSIFLEEMDNVVGIYENIASVKLGRIRNIEAILFAVSVLIILAEILFVFLPLIKALFKKKEELKRSVISLEQNKNELEQLTYAISHDLQEPISLVEGLIQRSKKKNLKSFDISERLMGMLETQINKANKLLSELLLYTGSKINRTKESFDLKKLVEEVKVKIGKNELIDTSSLHNIKVYGYKNDISLVIEHLLINAITYKAENRKLQVKIFEEIEDQFYVLKIKDNGKGIASTRLSVIFNLFKRLELSKTNANTGFGLAFCKKIIEDHGGSIGVHSKPDEGSEFFFKLPIAS